MARTMPLEHETRRSMPRAAGVHKWMIALAVVLLLGSAAFFQFDEPSSYLYGIVLLFSVVALGLPWILWRIGRRHPEAHPEMAETDPESASHHGSEGLGDAIIPIAAVSLGMVALVVVLHFAVD